MNNLQHGKFVKTQQPCPDDKCGSSDACSIREDGSALCFSCEQNFKSYDKPYISIATKPIQEPKETFLNSYTGSFNPLTDRNISQKTATKYRVRSVLRNNKVIKHIYPYLNANEIVATVTRDVDSKKFWTDGNFEGTGLFGENLFKGGGKYLTITEGECDAMAAYQMQGSKWAVVSIRGGVKNAVNHVRSSLEFVESFDNVVLCFDADDQGRKAAREVARIISPNKTKLMSFPEGYKDANDMLRQNKGADFVTSWWESKVYTPTGIMELHSKKSEWLERKVKPSVPYPWNGLNKKLYGMRKGELVTLTGGTGLGKSSVTRELEHHLIKTTKDNVGIIALEENWQRTADGILSIEAEDRIYLNEKRKNYTEEQLEELFDRVIEKGRVYIHAHLGATDIDEIFSKLRYIIVGCQCEWVIVDHLHMLVNVLTEGDERRGIDMLMNRLRSLVEETGVGMILVSHLRRAQGDKGHEKGIEVSLSHLKGSQGIAQLSDCVIALERNQQALDPEQANTTKVRVLKSRYTGDTGLACSLKYDINTGRLHESDEIEEEFDGFSI
jgi:twinkle protein